MILSHQNPVWVTKWTNYWDYYRHPMLHSFIKRVDYIADNSVKTHIARKMLPVSCGPHENPERAAHGKHSEANWALLLQVMGFIKC